MKLGILLMKGIIVCLSFQPSLQDGEFSIENDASLAIGSASDSEYPARKQPAAVTPNQPYPTDAAKFFSEALKANNNGSSIVELFSISPNIRVKQIPGVTEVWGGRKVQIGDGVTVPAVPYRRETIYVPIRVVELYLFDPNLPGPKQKFVATLDEKRNNELNDHGRITPNNQNKVHSDFEKALLNPQKLEKLAADYNTNPTAFYQKHLPLFFPADVVTHGYVLLDTGTDLGKYTSTNEKFLYNMNAKDFPPRNETYQSNLPIYSRHEGEDIKFIDYSGKNRYPKVFVSGTRGVHPSPFTEAYLKNEIPKYVSTKN